MASFRNLHFCSTPVGVILEEKQLLWESLLKSAIFTYSISLSGDVSPAELMMRTIGDVIQQLIEAQEQGKDIDLNK